MSLKRYACARDANEPEIVKALELAGATVVRLDKPVDLLVGFRGTNYLLEVKLPLKPRAKSQAKARYKGGSSHSYLTPAQSDFVVSWKGEVHIVRTDEEAVFVIMRGAGLVENVPPQSKDCKS